MVINCKMKATKGIEMEIAADVQTKKCNGIGGEPQGLCGQKVIHVIYQRLRIKRKIFSSILFYSLYKVLKITKTNSRRAKIIAQCAYTQVKHW